MESITWLSASVLWFIIGIVIFLMELASPGFFMFFFGIGAWIVGFITIFLDISLAWQLLIFLTASLLLLILLRQKFTTLFKGFKTDKENPEKDIDDIVGKRVIVIERIVPPNRGRVELHGTSWQAESDDILEKGDNVEIIEKNNIILKVKK